ncbi:MAG TPA: endolytic transglycosylase MltG, partial [Candidatus Saccharimonadales bacterium]|nr:endolytic transglycosylase MltG [Candidatus Saccharimonadales bacterium]
TFESSYNTYSNKGLPPGPISNVTQSSLQAVARPAGTDWTYFVSGDDGRTHFSRTLAEHEALTAQYCRKLCSLNP